MNEQYLRELSASHCCSAVKEVCIINNLRVYLEDVDHLFYCLVKDDVLLNDNNVVGCSSSLVLPILKHYHYESYKKIHRDCVSVYALYNVVLKHFLLFFYSPYSQHLTIR